MAVVYVLLLIFYIVAGIFLAVTGLFISNILLFDTIGLSILAGALANNYLPIHPTFCLLIGIAVFVLLNFIHSTKIGFWIISIIMSIFFSLIISVIVTSKADMTWFYVVFGLLFSFILGLHISARSVNGIN